MKTNIISFNPLELKTGIIAHLNFTAVMGTSIESAFWSKFYSPLKQAKAQPVSFGKININWFNCDLCLVNLGALHHNQLNYDALALSLYHLSQFSQQSQTMPFIPYGIGCGLLGGNWEKIASLIAEYCPHSLVWKFPKYTVTSSTQFNSHSNVIYLPSSIEEARLMA